MRRRAIRNYGIRKKFMLAFSGVMVIAFLLASGVSLLVHENEIKEQLRKDSYAIADLMRSLASQTTLSRDEIIALSQTSFFYEVEVIEPTSIYLDDEQWDLLRQGEVVFVRAKTLPSVQSYVQIHDDLMTIQVKDRNVFVANELTTRFLALGFTLGAAILLFIPFTRRLLNPLLRLNDAMQKVAQGEFTTQIPVGNADEIGQLSKNFNLMTQELQSTERLRNDFVQAVSHELQTPLTAISGFAQLLQDPTVTTQQRQEYAAIIEQESQRLSTMSNQILRLSKLETSHFARRSVHFDLAEQLRQTIVTLEPMWSERELELDLVLPDCPVCHDDELLALVWTNLLGNAMKFSPVGGCLQVILTQDATTVQVAITDQGIGMNAEEVARIFEKFYQAATQRNVQGNGLGLALVKEILTHANGSVYVVSAPGEGSTFTVTLPKLLGE